MNALSVRPATPADIPVIRDLALRTWPTTFAEILAPEQIDYMLALMYSPEALAEQMGPRGHRFLIAQTADGPVGYLAYELDYRPRVAKVHKLYVLPDTQGHGVGRELLNAASARAVAARQTHLRLDVNYRNPATGFYERMGFTKVAEHTTDIGEGFLMEDYVYEIGL